MGTEVLEKYSAGWFADRWEYFLRGFRRIEEIAADNENDTDEVKTQTSTPTPRKPKGYDTTMGHYFNFISTDMFTKQLKTIVIDYKDIQTALTFGAGPSEKPLAQEDLIALDTQIRYEPYEAERALKMAVYRILKQIHPDYAMEIKDLFKARFKNIIDRKELSDITNGDIGRLFSFEGFVTAVDESTRMLYKTTTWQCRNSHNTQVDGRQKPYKCDQCNNSNMSLVASTTDTYQEFRLQQKPDQTKDGRMAVEREIVCVGSDIVQLVQGGDYVEVSGIVKVREKQASMSYKRKNSDVVDFYIEASWVEKKPEDTIMMQLEADSLYLEDEVKEAVHPEAEESVQELEYEKLWRSVAPTIIGHEIVKQALLLQMASSDSRTFEDGTPHRGHITLLFSGSPASAKTVMARYIQKIHIRSVFPSGDGVTKAGLTAAVNTKVEPVKLSAGAYLMAKNGICIIDELQSIKQDVLDALLEALEDAQTITITKAGIHRPLKADCASLHLCNPRDTSYWDDTKNIMENTGFKANLLSRYDAVIVFRDIPDPEVDQERAEHWMRQYSNSVRNIDKPKDIDLIPRRKSPGTKAGLYSPPFMAQWLRYVRKTFHPVLEAGSDAYRVIQDFYLSTRRLDARYFSQGEVDEDDIRKRDTTQKIPSITMRQLASLYRWAEASARAHHRDKVTVRDAIIACDIVRFSILNSGFNPINKSAYATAARSDSLTPMVRMIDVVQAGMHKQNIFVRAAKKQAEQFANQIKKIAIGKCIYCKGKGQVTDTYTSDPTLATHNCDQCNHLGSVKIAFDITQIKDSLKHLGFSSADVDMWEEKFADRGVIKKNKTGLYETVEQYDITKGMSQVKLVDFGIEEAFDFDGNIAKARAVAKNLPASKAREIQDMVDKLPK